MARTEEPTGTASATSADPQLERRIRLVCEAVGDFIKYWGFKSILGRVWAVLALTHRPLTQAEMVSFLGVSRSQVSEAIAELTELGLVRATQQHRNSPFVAELDVWPVIADVLRRREWMLIESARLALEAAVEEVDRGGRVSAALYSVEHLQTLLTMTELAQSLLRIVISARSESGQDLLRWAQGAKGFLSTLSRMMPSE